jgi:unsaturated chondroitin disaccharide hydrolase
MVHIQPAGSTAHRCVFSPATGHQLRPCTATPQGYANRSTWARGQAWAIYGFTMAYRYARDPALLQAARATAAFFANRTDATGGVPPWDFDAPQPEAWPDASAAAIAASGLLELAELSGDVAHRRRALLALDTLASAPALRAPPARSPAVLGACRHDCGDDQCSLIESDYYLYEALRRLDGAWPRPPDERSARPTADVAVESDVTSPD